MRKILWFTLLACALLFGLVISGPKLTVDDTLPVVAIPLDIEAYLNRQEAQFSDLRPHSEKIIIWAEPNTKQKTPYAIVFIHGYGASRQGMAPLPEQLAAKIGANLFYTRIKGHGRTSVDAMGEGSTEDWLIDGAEAMEIGKRLGEKTILMGQSTG